MADADRLEEWVRAYLNIARNGDGVTPVARGDAGAVLALTYPFAWLFELGKEDRDQLFTAVFFGLPGLLALLGLGLIRRLLSR